MWRGKGGRGKDKKERKEGKREERKEGGRKNENERTKKRKKEKERKEEGEGKRKKEKRKKKILIQRAIVETSSEFCLAAAAAKSLSVMSDSVKPIDGIPPGFPVPGILQARTLEWVAISFSNAWKWKVKGKSFSCVQLLVTTWTTAYQAPLSIGFSRQEYWSGVPLPSPNFVLEAIKLKFQNIRGHTYHTYTYGPRTLITKIDLNFSTKL